MVFNVLDYGAVSDGLYVNTKHIQSAIDDCSVNGGRVVIPAGRFVTGSLELKSNVELHLEHGAELIASPNPSDYNELDAYPQNWGCPNEGWDGKHLIWSSCQENVAISGSGIIDGAGEVFFGEPKLIYPGYGWRFGSAREKECYDARPGQLIVFAECKNVRVTDVDIKNSCSWALYFHGCDWVRVHGISVKNPIYNLNTDGIDVDACRYVTISDCIIDTGDDAITFRCSGLNRLVEKRDVCEHVTVSNCVLSSGSSCFRIGVGTGTIRHIRVSGITVLSSGVAINFNPEWGTSATPTYDVSFSDMTAVDTGGLFYIFSKNTRVSDISLINVYSECDCAVLIKSQSEENVYNVTLRDIQLKKIDIVVQNREEFATFGNVGSLVCENVKLDGAPLEIIN